MKHIAETIIEREILKLEEMSRENPEPLGRVEATMLNDYMKTLIASKKDERETMKSENLASKSDDEMDDLIREALDYLGEDKRG